LAAVAASRTVAIASTIFRRMINSYVSVAISALYIRDGQRDGCALNHAGVSCRSRDDLSLELSMKQLCEQIQTTKLDASDCEGQGKLCLTPSI
jgi:hypothetical protein